MADIIDLNTLELGTYLSFTCAHPTDLTVYEGKLIGRSTYAMVKFVDGDVVPYHREVAKVLTSIPPYTELIYLILEYEQDGQKLQVVRAIDWINASSIKIINPTQSFDIRVYNREKGIDGQRVIDLLQSHGYISGYVPD